MSASVSELRAAARERILKFAGGCNFRDIGGYRIRDERSIKWGKVYRTGVLSYFTADDHAPLQDLGVRAICDLRRADERHSEPTCWPDAAAAALSWDDGAAAPTIRSLTAGRPLTAAGMFDSMIDLYRALPVWMGARIGGLFECIAADKIPLVVHCAAGKDRTGIAIAVLLGTLGVDRDTIVADYLLTNDAGDFEEFIRTRHSARLGLTDAAHPLLAMPQDVRRVLFSATAEFLAVAFERIDELGGLDAYLERVAGVSTVVRERVAEALIE